MLHFYLIDYNAHIVYHARIQIANPFAKFYYKFSIFFTLDPFALISANAPLRPACSCLPVRSRKLAFSITK